MFAAVATVALVLAGAAATTTVASATVSDDASFEFDDGDLAHDAAMDWNDFAPVLWSGTAPYRTGEGAANGWDFTGIEDDEASNADTGFGGGTKQDDSCPQVKGSKAPNKDDLRRIYVTSSTIDGDVFLGLSWTRIPQNNTSASAHIGFEFNQGQTLCGGNSGSLVERTAGDMLVVYDFAGGDTEPTLTLRRWVTSGACEVGSNSPPCWGPSSNLTALGYAVAKVNTFGAVTDAIGPNGSESVGASEFGEAGINLTAAGVFGENVCAAFGNVYAVSRSSGNSAQAQMKDLVGPGDIDIANCGRVIIHKATDPAGDATSTFDFTATGGLTPASFGLKDGETQDYGATVFAGPYSVTEADPSGLNYELASIDCSASDVGNGSSYNPDLVTRTVSFVLQPNDTIECTFTNQLLEGAILVTKTRKHAADGPGDHPHPGVDFTVDGVTKTTDANGQACFDGFAFGNYDVTETLPAGYAADGALTKSVTVDNKATCADNPYVGETVSFANTPLTDLTVSVNSQVPGGTNSQITCSVAPTPADATPNAFDDTSETAEDLLPGTYTCTVVIDP